METQSRPLPQLLPHWVLQLPQGLTGILGDELAADRRVRSQLLSFQKC
jgi:hypothetical protein